MTSLVVAFAVAGLALPALALVPHAPVSQGSGAQPGGPPTFIDRAMAHEAATSTAPAVPWRAIDIDGRAWSGEALRGRVVLVDFWATWCAPCLEELPRLRQLHARQASHGLTIIGVSLDRASPRDFRSWLQRQAITWPQVREPGQYDSPLARTFGVEAIPASYLFDRNGRLHATSLRGDALEARVAALVEAR